MSTDHIEVTVNSTTIEWYRSAGYDVPTHEVQLWRNGADGTRVKNGVERRVARSTRIMVRRSDLPPSSNMRVKLVCQTCGSDYFTQWRAASIKKSANCKACVLAEVKTTGSHGYWVERLITNNQEARCDISGECDKRFLVLHHLLSRSAGGQNEPSNYVILSANYHLAFHVWNGGMNVLCSPDQYAAFKAEEMKTRSQA